MSAAPAATARNVQPDGPRNPTLDGLRGLAVGLVLICHYFVGLATPAGLPGLQWLQRALTFSFGGVELFFVLSGYLIGSILLQKKQAPNLLPVFYARRACRILPVYALLLASFALVSACKGLNEVSGGYYLRPTIPLWSYLLLVQNNLMGTMRNIGPWWLVVTWSLAVEEQFYLVAPWLVKRLSPGTLIALAVVAVFTCPALRWILVHLDNNPFGACYMTITRIDSLMVGLALACFCAVPGRLQGLVRWKYHLNALVAMLAAVFFIWPLVFSPGESFIIIWAPTLLGLSFATGLLWLLAFPDNAIARILRRPFWVFIGAVSYFAYLFHLPFLYTAHFLVNHTLAANRNVPEILGTLLALALTLVAAAVSRRWLELPLISLGHRFTYKTP